jgi:hypothetical protein
MTEERERRHTHESEAEEVKEILSVVSKEVPALVKGILGSVFSEEAGRDLGKAAAAFYKELKSAGLPDEVAVKMTEDYMATFTSLGDLLKGMGKGGKFGITAKDKDELGKEITLDIQRKIKEKLAEKHRTSEDDEEEDDDKDED